MRWMASWALLIGACQHEPTTDTGTPGDTVDTREVGSDTDTGITWKDTGSAVPHETDSVLDAPIGPTALDGTWTGTFTYTEVGPIGKDPQCIGDVTLTIHGDAPRHVSGEWICTHWDPNTPLGLGYAKLNCYTFATLDPTDLTRFPLDGAFGARNMQLWELQRRPMLVVDDTLTLDIDLVTGIGALRAGHKLTATLTRATP